jgi:REP element-mobilizing transposase RayT
LVVFIIFYLHETGDQAGRSTFHNMKHKTTYRRNLPHIQPKDGVFAITICLSGALPASKIETLKDNRNLEIAEIKAKQLPPQEERETIFKARQVYFGKFDDLLDGQTSGPTWLKRIDIANTVAEGLHFRDGRDFKLVCYCIMSNHIHLVVYKCQKQLFKILEQFKSYTGLQVNNILYGQAKKGENRPQFWQHESYDHLIRNRMDFNAQVRYAMNNPVKAGLVGHYSDWKLNYLNKTFEYLM